MFESIISRFSCAILVALCGLFIGPPSLSDVPVRQVQITTGIVKKKYPNEILHTNSK